MSVAIDGDTDAGIDKGAFDEECVPETDDELTATIDDPECMILVSFV